MTRFSTNLDNQKNIKLWNEFYLKKTDYLLIYNNSLSQKSLKSKIFQKLNN